MASIAALLNSSCCSARVQQYALEMVLNLTGDTADRSAAVLDACDEEQLLSAFCGAQDEEERAPPELAELRVLLALPQPQSQARDENGRGSDNDDGEAQVRAALRAAIERERARGIGLVVAQLDPLVAHLARSLETLAAALRRRGRTFGARLRQRQQEASEASAGQQQARRGKQRAAQSQRAKRPPEKKNKQARAASKAAKAPRKTELSIILRITSRHVMLNLHILLSHLPQVYYNIFVRIISVQDSAICP